MSSRSRGTYRRTTLPYTEPQATITCTACNRLGFAPVSATLCNRCNPSQVQVAVPTRAAPIVVDDEQPVGRRAGRPRRMQITAITASDEAVIAQSIATADRLFSNATQAWRLLLDGANNNVMEQVLQASMHDTHTSRKSKRDAAAAQKMVEALPESLIDAKDVGETCCICMDSFEADTKLPALASCSHLFHKPCLVKWVGSKNTCPICRAPCVELPKPVS